MSKQEKEGSHGTGSTQVAQRAGVKGRKEMVVGVWVVEGPGKVSKQTKVSCVRGGGGGGAPVVQRGKEG